MGNSSKGIGNSADAPPIRKPPARTRVRRAQQLSQAAENLLEERILSGKASPTEVVAALRLGTEIERVNIERIQAQTEYLAAQKAKAEAETLNEKLFADAIAAMSVYSGEADRDD